MKVRFNLDNCDGVDEDVWKEDGLHGDECDLEFDKRERDASALVATRRRLSFGSAKKRVAEHEQGEEHREGGRRQDRLRDDNGRSYHDAPGRIPVIVKIQCELREQHEQHVEEDLRQEHEPEEQERQVPASETQQFDPRHSLESSSSFDLEGKGKEGAQHRVSQHQPKEKSTEIENVTQAALSCLAHDVSKGAEYGSEFIDAHEYEWTRPNRGRQTLLGSLDSSTHLSGSPLCFSLDSLDQCLLDTSDLKEHGHNTPGRHTSTRTAKGTSREQEVQMGNLPCVSRRTLCHNERRQTKFYLPSSPVSFDTESKGGNRTADLSFECIDSLCSFDTKSDGARASNFSSHCANKKRESTASDFLIRAGPKEKHASLCVSPFKRDATKPVDIVLLPDQLPLSEVPEAATATSKGECKGAVETMCDERQGHGASPAPGHGTNPTVKAQDLLDGTKNAPTAVVVKRKRQSQFNVENGPSFTTTVSADAVVFCHASSPQKQPNSADSRSHGRERAHIADYNLDLLDRHGNEREDQEDSAPKVDRSFNDIAEKAKPLQAQRRHNGTNDEVRLKSFSRALLLCLCLNNQRLQQLKQQIAKEEERPRNKHDIMRLREMLGRYLMSHEEGMETILAYEAKEAEIREQVNNERRQRASSRKTVDS